VGPPLSPASSGLFALIVCEAPPANDLDQQEGKHAQDGGRHGEQQY